MSIDCCGAVNFIILEDGNRECSACGSEDLSIKNRPEPYLPLTFTEAWDICMNGGCVYVMGYSGDSEFPDYPVECPDDCAEIEEAMNMGERVTWLEYPRHPATVRWDRVNWQALAVLDTQWRRA